MRDLWMPGAEKLDVGDHAPTDQQYPAKVIAHITWDESATAAKPVALVPYENLKGYFTGGGKGVAPHILWDPFTGRFAQFYPADSRSKSLVDLSGGTRTNRAGKVVIQIEALFFPYCEVDGKVYAKLTDTPLKGWDKLSAWIKSLGIVEIWPMGKPVDFSSDRDEHVWETQGGWYGHQQVPENTHQDPGSWPGFIVIAKPKPIYATYPGTKFFKIGNKHPLFTAMANRLKAEGYKGYKEKTPNGVFDRGDIKAYAWWQKKLGYTGSSADGYPGKESWDKLKVPQA